MPSPFLRFSSKAQQLKKDFKKYVHNFLSQIKDRSSLLSEILKESDVTKQEQNLRMLFAMLLAVNNISHTINQAIMQINAKLFFEGREPEKESPTLDKFRENISEEVQGKSNSFEELMLENNVPYLHALYLESLRTSSSVMPIVSRYTRNAIIMGNLKIPNNSTILYQMQKKVGFKDANLFEPNRFIDSKDCPALNQGSNTPFGLGNRACPAQAISKAIFMGVAKIILEKVTMEYQQKSNDMCYVLKPTNKAYKPSL